MSAPEFFQTVMGRRFYEGSVPALVAAVERLATAAETIARELVAARQAREAPPPAPPGPGGF